MGSEAPRANRSDLALVDMKYAQASTANAGEFIEMSLTSKPPTCSGLAGNSGKASSSWRALRFTTYLLRELCARVFDYVGKERRRMGGAVRPFAREVSIGDACIFVDHGFVWDGSQNVWLTRARASFVLGSGPIFELKPRPLLARVTGFLGGARSGDPCFDDFFTMHTASPTQTWSALTTRVRSLLACSFEDARLVSDGHMITLWREGDFGYESDAEAATEAVAKIAHYQSDALHTLRSLPSAVCSPAHGPWYDRAIPSVSLNPSSPVRLGPRMAGRSLAMSAWSNCGRTLRRFYLSIDELGTIHGDERRLPSHAFLARDVIKTLGPCEVICDGRQVEIRWPHLFPSKQQLMKAARCVAALSRHNEGLYR